MKPSFFIALVLGARRRPRVPRARSSRPLRSPLRNRRSFPWRARLAQARSPLQADRASRAARQNGFAIAPGRTPAVESSSGREFPPTRASSSISRSTSAAATPLLDASPRGVHFDQHPHRRRGARAGERQAETRGVEAMDEREPIRRVARLVGLQVADQMPSQISVEVRKSSSASCFAAASCT